MNEMPRSLQAERALLGSVILNSECFHRVALHPDEFTHERHRVIWTEIVDMMHRDGAVNLVLLAQGLVNRRRIDQAGGHAYVAELIDNLPSPELVEKYAAKVKESAIGRTALRLMNDASKAIGAGDSPVQVAQRMANEFAALGKDVRDTSTPLPDAMKAAREMRDELAKRGRQPGVRTGFNLLDKMTGGGFPRKNLLALAGPTGQGKSTLGLNLALGACDQDESVRTLIFSLEMDSVELGERAISFYSGIPLHTITGGWRFLRDEERENITACEERARDTFGSRLLVNSSFWSIDQVMAECYSQKRKGGLDLVIVDYLQLLEGVDDRSRERVVNQLAWRLLRMAKDLDLCVIALSQVDDEVERRSGHRLKIRDVRESKALGHHSWGVFLFSRPQKFNPEAPGGLECEAVLQVEKVRQGVTGDIEMHFDGATQRITEGRHHTKSCGALRGAA